MQQLVRALSAPGATKASTQLALHALLAWPQLPRAVQRVLREWNLLQEKRRVEEKLAAAEKIARDKSALLETI